MKRILILSESTMIRTFVLPALVAMKQEADVRLDCWVTKRICPEEHVSLKEVFNTVYVNQQPSGFFARIPGVRFIRFVTGLRKIAGKLPFYDVVHINFHHYYYAFLIRKIRKKAQKLCVTFFGSDFNHDSWYRHRCNRRTIAFADQVWATNPTLLDSMIRKYNLIALKKGTGILVPLLKTFQSFGHFLSTHDKGQAKQEWDIRDKLITCGYQADAITRHEDIIRVLISLKEQLNDFDLVFPMTYGHLAETRRSKIRSLLLHSGLQYHILEDFLAIEKIMSLRLATDIFIHIQSRDQMSGSMLEHLAAGSVVITGKWLPYDSLERLGVYFIRINKTEELRDELINVMLSLDRHLELCRKNREIVFNLMTWEHIKHSWYEAYDLHHSSENVAGIRE